MVLKRVSLFMGHYGSGKTNVAVNYSQYLRTKEKKVTVYDLDIVNPYFRTVDAKARLDKADIGLVVSPYAETNVDIPAMPARLYNMLEPKNGYAVVDLGGDDRGALALGRVREGLLEENNCDVLLVLNKYRPETRTVDGALEMIAEIEATSGMKFTAIVSNPNLGTETNEEIILSGNEFSEKVSGESGLPIRFTAVERKLFRIIAEKIKNVIPLDLIKYGDWL